MQPGLEFRSVLLRADTRVELLRRLPLLELCSKRDLRRIAAIAVEREVDAGAELIREGESPAGEFYIVVEARWTSGAGRRVARLGDGSFVGEIALLSRSPRTATVIAERRFACWRSPAATSWRCSTRCPAG